jgi:hypothetical protein
MRSGPGDPQVVAEGRSRRFVAAVVFVAAGEDSAAATVGEVFRAVENAIWVSAPAAADRADSYELLEIRLLGDGDLIVVSPGR